MANFRKHYEFLVKNVKYLRHGLKTAEDELYKINRSQNGNKKS